MLANLKQRLQKNHFQSRFKPPFKIGLRTQLTILVCAICVLSLVIITVATGVYYTTNYRSIRAERLQVAAQLKSSQIDQNLNYLYYQIYWLSSRDTLQNALVNYRAGNSSRDNWGEAEDSVEKFLGSSNLFSAARVYDTSFMTVLNSTNNGSGDFIPDDVSTKLFPLSGKEPLSSSLLTTGIVTDPVLNSTDYLLSMSLPISTNPSIILNTNEIAGYITVIASAESLKAVVNDTVALERSDVAILSAVFDNSSSISGFHFVFPPFGQPHSIIDNVYPIKNDTFVPNAFENGRSGSVTRTHIAQLPHVAVGYCPTTFKLVSWVAVISQPENVFLSPTIRLTRIIAGTVCGIAVFMCLLTFPIAHWAVQPIVRLQKATEIIAAGRGLKHYSNTGTSDSTTAISHSRTRSSSNQNQAMKLFNRSVAKGTSSNYANPNYNLYPSNPSSENASASMSARNSMGTPRNTREIARSPSLGSIPNSNEALSYTSEKYTKSTNLVDAYVPVYRRLFQDELSELTDTFNTMTDELDRHYALLEDRVRARTKQLEAAKIEAEAANEAKTVFIANISHELRTPLNGILGMTAIAMAETDMQKIQNSLKLIFRSGELLLHILTELLTFSKNVLKRTKLEERDFSVMDIALQIKSIFGKLAKDQHVKLSILLTPNLIRSLVLWGDSNRIIQVVMNLVSNALKFTPIDGKVDVRIKLLGEYDEESSKNADYTEVFVLPNTEPSDKAECDQKSKNIGDNSLVLSSSNECSYDEKYSPTSSNSVHNGSSIEGMKIVEEHNVVEEEDEEDDMDNLSTVTTSSSSSYDDAVFHSQFKKALSAADSDEEENTFRSIEKPKTWVISIEVEDTGSGIDPKLQESVFEPFVQGDQTLSRQYGGTGLGLSICRQLASMMKGTMKLDSDLGVGSKFTFTVPLMQTKEIIFDSTEKLFEDEFNPDSRKNRKVKFKVNSSKRSVQTKKSKSSIEGYSDGGVSDRKSASSTEKSVGNVRVDRPFLQSTGTALSTRSVPAVSSETAHHRVLVAEDNNVNQEVIKRMLQLEGLNDIDMACDGKEAFEKVSNAINNNEFYSIIFMDVQMPNVDGLLATKMIRKDLSYSGPIVALTAYADESNIKVCLESGMDGFLSKPIKRPLLKEIIEKYCSKKE